jgi:CRISPR/Cas system CMR subunit Cmr6 (Cas7 group RAMP superfamily)
VTVEVYGVLRPFFPARLHARVEWPVALGQANANLLLRRMRIGTGASDDEVQLRTVHLGAVARSCGAVPTELLGALHQRRQRAAQELAARTRGLACRALRITPMWRMVVGHGEDSVQDSSISLSATYGVPIIPGSGIKGMAAAYACGAGTEPEDLDRTLGLPRADRPGANARQGTVRFFDGLPLSQPSVVVDVLTPHVKPYYDQGNDNGRPTAAPAEYHNPVPVRFLAVADTPFRMLLLGPAGDVDLVSSWVMGALDDQGIGGKTSAGYGYCTAAVEDPW